jgi:15-hydroxyprostaglandin dehydrogenase (NAD)
MPSLAIITGGARGLGFAFAEALLSAKLVDSVALLDLFNAERASFDIEGRFGVASCRGWTCDVTNLDALERCFREATEWGRSQGHALRVVVNNAGIVSSGLRHCSKAVGVNLTAVIEGTGLAFELMSRTGGTVINVASFGAFVPMPFSPVYAATKSAVVALTRSCHHLADPTLDPMTGAPLDEPDGGRGKVHVVALCPAFADTAMVRDPMKAERNKGAFSAVVDMQGGLMTTEFVASFVTEIVTRCRAAEDDPSAPPCDLAGQAIVVLPKGGITTPPPSFRGTPLERHSKL